MWHMVRAVWPSIALFGFVCPDESRAASVPAREQCSLYEAQANDTDVAGTELANAWAASSDDCCTLCDAEAECQGFAFLDGMCYLKGAFSGTFAKSGVTSRLRSDLGQGCPGYEPAQQNKDLVGTLLEEWHASNSGACCASCAGKVECQGFAFVGDRCYLKGNVTGTWDNEGVVARVKEGVLPASSPAPPQCPDFDAPAAETDMAGELLAEMQASTIDGCCVLCNEQVGCEGFAYSQQTCYLKTHFLGTFPKTGVVTRLRQNIGAGCPGFEAAAQDKDLAGELLEDWSASSLEVCCSACAEKSECQGFAFNDGRCYLKKNVQGTYDHVGCVVRVKSPQPQCGQFDAELVDTDMAGALLLKFPGASLDACCAKCEKEQGCEGFAFSQGVCYLKANFTGTFSQAGVVTRLRASLGAGCPGFSSAQGEQDKDLSGRTLDHWPATRPEVCCAACAQKTECQGFAFNAGQCWLKADVVGTYQNEGCLVNVKTDVLAGGHRRLGEVPRLV